MKIYASSTLKTEPVYMGALTQYSTDKLTVLVPQQMNLTFSWINPDNYRFAERPLFRDSTQDELEPAWNQTFGPSYDLDWGLIYDLREIPNASYYNEGYVIRYEFEGQQHYIVRTNTTTNYAYSATLYPVFTAGRTNKALLTLRSGPLFSPIIKVAVDASILPEQTELPPTAAEDLGAAINILNQELNTLKSRVEALEAAQE